MSFNQNEFYQFVNEYPVVLKGDFRLKSGERSDTYVSWDSITGYVNKLQVLSHFILAFAYDHKLEPDSFFGVPEGATKIGLITQYEYILNKKEDGILPMGRAKPKNHGLPRNKNYRGFPEGKTVIIEDTTTTAGSLIKITQQLIEDGSDVIAAICLMDRSKGFAQNNFYNQTGLQLYPMSHLDDILHASK